MRAGTIGRWSLVGGAVLVVAALFAAPFAQAGGPSYSVKAKVAGQKQDVWVANWWQWCYSLPGNSGHPVMTDDTGELAAMGQHGPVWFLGGIFGNNSGNPITRNISMPAGYPIFFPLMNST